MFTCIRKYQFIKTMKMNSQTPLTPRAVGGPVQSNPVNTDTEGAIKSVRKKNVRNNEVSALSGYISCILLRSIEKIEGQESRGHPFSFEISTCCYRIVRTMKSIFIDDKWVSVPATPF